MPFDSRGTGYILRFFLNGSGEQSSVIDKGYTGCHECDEFPCRLFDLLSEDLMFVGPLFQFKSAKEYKEELRWKLLMFRMHRMLLGHIVMQ